MPNLLVTEIKIESKSPQIVKAVKAFQIGVLFPPKCLTNITMPRLSNWASLPSTPDKNPQGLDIDGDWFFEDKNLIPGVIKIEQTE